MASQRFASADRHRRYDRAGLYRKETRIVGVTHRFIAVGARARFCGRPGSLIALASLLSASRPAKCPWRHAVIGSENCNQNRT